MPENRETLETALHHWPNLAKTRNPARKRKKRILSQRALNSACDRIAELEFRIRELQAENQQLQNLLNSRNCAQY